MKGTGIEAAMVANEAKWHQTCKLRYNNAMLQKAEKRKNSVEVTRVTVFHTSAADCMKQLPLRQLVFLWKISRF